jgi:hypothetical protein
MLLLERIPLLLITIRIPDIIHHHAFYFKRDVSETGFCLRLQVESTHMG